jgi:hypothetical protein
LHFQDNCLILRFVSERILKFFESNEPYLTVAASYKGKTLLYTCTIISSAAIVLIALNIFGIFTLPGPGGGQLPIGSGGSFDWKYVLSFNVFPVLILFNLVFWVFTAVSGQMFARRPGVRQAMQFFYSLLTLVLLIILAVRVL